MTRFVHSVLIFHKIHPVQLSALAWHTVLGFKALCDLYAPVSCQHEVFNTVYSLKKTTQGARYFVTQSRVEKGYCQHGQQQPLYARYRSLGDQFVGGQIER